MSKKAINITQHKLLTSSQKEDILSLWNNEYPAHLQYHTLAGLQEYLDQLIQPTHFIHLDTHQQVKAWLVSFTRDNARWFAMIVDGSLQGNGVGSLLLSAAKATETELNGWASDHDRDNKADGTSYRSPIGFYLKNGFEILEGIRLEKGELSTVKIRWRK